MGFFSWWWCWLNNSTLIPSGAQACQVCFPPPRSTDCPVSRTGPNTASPSLPVTTATSGGCCFRAVSTALLLQLTIQSSQKPWGTNRISSSVILHNTDTHTASSPWTDPQPLLLLLWLQGPSHYQAPRETPVTIPTLQTSYSILHLLTKPGLP